jgi:hypothetical protein
LTAASAGIDRSVGIIAATIKKKQEPASSFEQQESKSSVGTPESKKSVLRKKRS